jgi:hypothetical protein
MNDQVVFGGSLYQARQDTLGNDPTSAANWSLVVSGFRLIGSWATATQYYVNDIVSYGGNTYVALIYHASAAFQIDLAAARWQKFNGGIRWRGVWGTGSSYLANDIVTDNVSTYIALVDHVAGASIASDLTATNLQVLALGQSVLPNMTGKAGLVLGNDGVNPLWVQGVSRMKTAFYASQF